MIHVLVSCTHLYATGWKSSGTGMNGRRKKPSNETNSSFSWSLTTFHMAPCARQTPGFLSEKRQEGEPTNGKQRRIIITFRWFCDLLEHQRVTGSRCASRCLYWRRNSHRKGGHSGRCGQSVFFLKNSLLIWRTASSIALSQRPSELGQSRKSALSAYNADSSVCRE